VISNGNPLRRPDIGLVDKLYWRRVASGWHCFAPANNRRPRLYESLCGRETLTRSGGQSITRPLPWLRCASCDGREMARRGWDEIGPETIPETDVDDEPAPSAPRSTR
jgi:hypothetical protein